MTEPRCPDCERLIELATDHADGCRFDGLDGVTIGHMVATPRPETVDGGA